MGLLFLVLAVPAVLRQNVGNDYMRYVAFFHLANMGEYVPTEPGFNWLVRLVYGLSGYENCLLVFAVFSVLTVLLFLAAIRRGAKDFFFSFFLFMAFGYYFQTYNTVRYYFALALVTCALVCFVREEYLFFAALVVTAALFHKSAVAVLVLWPLCRIRWKWQAAAACAAVLAASLQARDFWMRVVVRLYPSYEGTAFLAGGRPSYVNIVRCAAVLILAAACLRGRRDDVPVRVRFFVKCDALALFLYVFASFIPEISRICYYLTVAHIFLIPELVAGVRDERMRKRLTAFAAAAAVLYFMAFLYSARHPDVRILPYRTFLFHDMPEAIIE